MKLNIIYVFSFLYRCSFLIYFYILRSEIVPTIQCLAKSIRYVDTPKFRQCNSLIMVFYLVLFLYLYYL